MTKRKRPVFKLNSSEKELSDSFDRGEWERVKNLKKEAAKAHKAATNYLGKNQYESDHPNNK